MVDNELPAPETELVDKGDAVPENKTEESNKPIKQAWVVNRKGKNISFTVGELIPIKGLWFRLDAIEMGGKIVLQRRQ